LNSLLWHHANQIGKQKHFVIKMEHEKSKKTEYWNFVPISADKSPYIKDWPNKFWTQKRVWSGQSGVGFKQSKEHTTIDVDIPELNEKIDRLMWEKAVLVESGSGKRHIVIDQELNGGFPVPNSHLYLGDKKVADLLAAYNKQAVMPNFWDFDLPTSAKYKLLNGTERDFFNPPKVDLLKAIEELGLAFKKPVQKALPTPIQEAKQVSAPRAVPEIYPLGFDLARYLPTGWGETNENMAPLLRAIHYFGLEKDKECIFEEYLRLNRFKEDSDWEYRNKWNEWNRSFNQSKMSKISFLPLKEIPFKDIIRTNLNSMNKHKDQQGTVPNLYAPGIANKGAGPQPNFALIGVVHNVCRELSKFSGSQEFYLTSNWDEFGIGHQKIQKALAFLVKFGFIEIVQRGKPGIEGGKATRYRLLE
jgi:hypothetical protein